EAVAAVKAVAQEKQSLQALAAQDQPRAVISGDGKESSSPPADDEPIILAQEVVPCGKHQEKTFLDILDDKAYCNWVCKEPRAGWMGMLKVFLETEHGFVVVEEDEAEVDPEEVARQAEVAAARAKLLAKGAGKGLKKKPEPEKPAPMAYATIRIPFQATSSWQEVLPQHLCPKGLQFRMDVTSGKNYARLSV
ncbi:unnamed protein product, partial [Polarella glacialis]